MEMLGLKLGSHPRFGSTGKNAQGTTTTTKRQLHGPGTVPHTAGKVAILYMHVPQHSG